MLMRLLVFAVAMYLFFRFLRSVFASVSAPPGKPAQPAKTHAPDFSDVKEAEFEDITPPNPPTKK